MTNSITTPKREPSGAAVPGAHPRPINYPKQLVVMVTGAMYDFIATEAASEGTSKSDVARHYLTRGIEAEVAS